MLLLVNFLKHGTNMAEILNKARLISSYSGGGQKQNYCEFFVVLKTCSYSSGVFGAIRRFSCLKLKSQAVRSSSYSSRSHFHGKKLVFEVNEGMPNRGFSTTAQTSNAIVVLHFSLSPLTVFCMIFCFLDKNYYF